MNTKDLFQLRKMKSSGIESIYKIFLKKAQDKKVKEFILELDQGLFDHEFLNDNYILHPESPIELVPFIKNLKSEKSTRRNIFDCEMAINLYEQLNIKLEEASDPKLWNYLSLFPYRTYVIDRWSLNKKGANVISERMFYFKSTATTNSGHALARLWWGVHMTIDESLKDKYTYTKLIFQQGYSQVLFDLMERKFLFNNRNIIQAYLEFMHQRVSKDLTNSSKYLGKSILNHLKNFDLSIYTKEEIFDLIRDSHEFYKDEIKPIKK